MELYLLVACLFIILIMAVAHIRMIKKQDEKVFDEQCVKAFTPLDSKLRGFPMQMDFRAVAIERILMMEYSGGKFDPRGLETATDETPSYLIKDRRAQLEGMYDEDLFDELILTVREDQTPGYKLEGLV